MQAKKICHHLTNDTQFEQHYLKQEEASFSLPKKALSVYSMDPRRQRGQEQKIRLYIEDTKQKNIPKMNPVQQKNLFGFINL
mgnify:CR=1 FL=1